MMAIIHKLLIFYYHIIHIRKDPCILVIKGCVAAPFEKLREWIPEKDTPKVLVFVMVSNMRGVRLGVPLFFMVTKEYMQRGR